MKPLHDLRLGGSISETLRLATGTADVRVDDATWLNFGNIRNCTLHPYCIRCMHDLENLKCSEGNSHKTIESLSYE